MHVGCLGSSDVMGRGLSSHPRLVCRMPGIGQMSWAARILGRRAAWILACYKIYVSRAQRQALYPFLTTLITPSIKVNLPVALEAASGLRECTPRPLTI